jgi:hypothetical protein
VIENEFAEQVLDDRGQPMAMIVRRDVTPSTTSFVTPTDVSLQVGFVVYPDGGEIQRHAHLPIRREIVGTPEFLLVRSGRCRIDLYDDDRRHIASRELAAGDVVLLLAGGHGFEMLGDTVLLEVKQGPYTGLDEKERF